MNAPDRIWAAPNFHTDGWGIETEDSPTLPEGTWDLVKDGSPGEAEYVRHDPAALAASPEVQALISAAFDDFASMVVEEMRGALERKETPPDLSVILMRHVRTVAEAARAYPHADALTALAARDARMRAEGMERRLTDNALEALADLEHQQWAHWTTYMLDHISEENIARWRRQAATAYANLSETEKESDRKWARAAIRAAKEGGGE